MRLEKWEDSLSCGQYDKETGVVRKKKAELGDKKGRIGRQSESRRCVKQGGVGSRTATNL